MSATRCRKGPFNFQAQPMDKCVAFGKLTIFTLDLRLKNLDVEA